MDIDRLSKKLNQSRVDFKTCGLAPELKELNGLSLCLIPPFSSIRARQLCQKSFKYATKMIAILALAIPMACTSPNFNNEDGQSGSSGSTSDLAGEGLLFQCSLSKLLGSVTANQGANLYSQVDQRVISSIASRDVPFYSNPVEGTQIRLDCDQSSNEFTTGKVNFFLDKNYDYLNPDFIAVAETTLFKLAQPGRQLMAIKAVDEEGRTSTKTFWMITVCESGEPPVINTDGIYFSSSRANHITVNVTTSAIGDQSGLAFLWDINGDGVYELANGADLGIWSTELNFTMYSVYTDKREVAVRVMNTCGFESAYEIDIEDLDLGYIAAQDPAVVKDFVYIQADIRSFTAPTDPLTNGDVLLTWKPPETPKYVRCGLNWSDTGTSFGITAFNQYGTHSPHGLHLKLNKLPTSVSGDDVTASSTDGTAEVVGFTYSTDGAGDAQSALVFDKIDQCSVDIKIKFYKVVDPCGGQLAYDLAVNGGQILGEFSCPSLKSPNSNQTLRAENGKFFCDFGPATICPLDKPTGSSNQGGGAPPLE